MLAILFGLLGLVLGAGGQETGTMVGALAGTALGLVLQTRKKLKSTERLLGEARADIARLVSEVNSRTASPNEVDFALPSTDAVTRAAGPGPTMAVMATPPTPVGIDDAPPSFAADPAAADPAAAGPVSSTTAPTSGNTASPIAQPTAPEASPVSPEPAEHRVPGTTPQPVDRPLTRVYQWLFGGNTVVRVGLVVLMVGVVLLLKWAADNQLFPIEARLMLAASIAIGLLVVGYRSRVGKPGFGLTLQGGGIAGLYLTTFFAYRSYELIGSGFAFTVLAALAMFTCVLAVLQKAHGLAFIGLCGGYLAPIVASSGDGSHVGLFAYTALLNLVVLALVALQGWVNVARLGFLFTFGFLVGWRVLRYEPAHLATTELFVIVFFLTYLAVPVLLARRTSTEPTRGTGILFGTPLATLGVQAALLHEEPLYMALATVCLGLIYVGVARQLLTRGPALRQVGVAFVAIAAGFATVALPYALQTQGATGAAWSIEGAGIVWFGLRQNQKWTTAAGALLQLAGLLLYLASIDVGHDESWVATGVQVGLGAWLQAAALYATGYLGYRYAKDAPLGKLLQAALLAGGACLVLGPIAPIAELLDGQLSLAAIGVWVAVSVFVFDRVALALRYSLARLWALVVFPFVPVFGVLTSIDAEHVFAGWLALAWGALAFAIYYSVRSLVNDHLPRLAWVYAVALWWTCAVLAVEGVQLTGSVWDLGNAWVHAALLLSPVVGVFVCVRASTSERKWRWLGLHSRHEAAQRSVKDALLSWGATPIVLGLALVLLAQNAFVSGDAEPLPYLAVANPFDILQLGALAAMGAWSRRVRAAARSATLRDVATGYGYAVFGLAFVWFNALLARSVHHYADVEFSLFALFRSDTLQVTVSVAWAVVALTLMWWTSRTQWRTVWFVGAGLLGATLVKLFLIDLSRLGTGAKILTFLAVGVLVLLVGYLSPLPPARSADAERKQSGPKAGET